MRHFINNNTSLNMINITIPTRVTIRLVSYLSKRIFKKVELSVWAMAAVDTWIACCSWASESEGPRALQPSET